MILQEDQKIFPQIQKEGCLFLSYLKLAELNSIEWTPELINLAYIAAVDQGWIESNCRILNPDKMLTFLGLNLSGWIRHEPVTYLRRVDEIEIEEWHNPRTDLNHSILGSPFRWDPLGNSITVAQGKLVRKTIVRFTDKRFSMNYKGGVVV